MNYSGEKKAMKMLCDGESISIPSPNAKNYNRIEFNAKVVAFDKNAKVVISHGRTSPWSSAYIVIDAEAVYVYEFLREARLLEKIPHNLLITDSINVCISVGAGFIADLVITTPSGSFHKDIIWNGSCEDIRVESMRATFADCTLMYDIDGVNKDVWLFGDSYFDHWCKHMLERGAGNFYLDGHSGRGSEIAISSLNMNLSYSKPKKIVWLMGMNDPDGDEVNPSWLRCYYQLRDICLENDIELILSTVPNTPKISNRYKNEIVKGSGYRYLDVCSAVGADTSRCWKNGFIDSDGVHPSTEGARVIAEYILSALHEIE